MSDRQCLGLQSNAPRDADTLVGAVAAALGRRPIEFGEVDHGGGLAAHPQAARDSNRLPRGQHERPPTRKQPSRVLDGISGAWGAVVTEK